MNGAEELCNQIKHNIFWVFETGKYLGTFPYDILTYKLNIASAIWSFIIHLTAILLIINGYQSYSPFTKNRIEEYSVLLTKILLVSLAVKCVILFVFKFRVVNSLRMILLELNRVHVYFQQLSCLDVVPGIIQVSNLLDMVRYYLNIINIELINISKNQDKQHFIHLYKSRICVLNNMLPDNYLCRRKLKILLLLHFCLCNSSLKIVNKLYAIHIGIILFNECVQLTCNLYFIIVLYVQSLTVFSIWSYIAYLAIFALYNLFMMLWIIKHCEYTARTAHSASEIVYHKLIYSETPVLHSELTHSLFHYQAHSASEIVYHKLIYSETPVLHSELTHFLDRICYHKIQFTVFDFFDIDSSALRHVLHCHPPRRFATKQIVNLLSPAVNMSDTNDIVANIKRDTRLVFKLSQFLGSFPYNFHSLRLSKLYSLWSLIIYATVLKFLAISFTGFKLSSIQVHTERVEFYTTILAKFLILMFCVMCLVLLYHQFTMGKQLKGVFHELERVHSYFIQLSCEDVAPNNIARKQAWTISFYLIINLAIFIFRIIVLWKFSLSLTFALYMINFLTFSTILQVTNLLDLVKHYLNIINIELINISANQDKQHFIHLYKSRICVLNNMLPDNYLCRRKLKVIVQLHSSLCKLSHDIVNKTYSLPLFIIMLIQSIHLTTSLYIILVLILQAGTLMNLNYHIMYFTAWVVYNLFILLWIIRHCEATKYAGLSLLELVYHKIIYNEAPLLKPELVHFLELVCNHTIQFRALDMFDIDYTVLRHAMGAVITYGVILVQLSFAT
ncbi:hypothetical protein WDU94_014595 [Cyamophila willieti]